MVLDPSDEPRVVEIGVAQRLVQRVVLTGWACILFSALFLWLSSVVDSGRDGAGSILWASLLMVARLCGLASFAIGGVAIYNRRWTAGVLLMLLSVALPVVAFVVHGTI